MESKIKLHLPIGSGREGFGPNFRAHSMVLHPRCGAGEARSR